ncbi:MAG: zinc ABC transporter substrate-binding protein [Deltaproteobacteria bacterium]|nr:zinc ABC transporter substrate-binding protein [Deltaproteobacteria bacterium]
MKDLMSFSIVFIIIFASVVVCSHAAGGQSEKLTVYTVNYPLKYFAERIAGEHAKVEFPAPPDVDSAYWMPNAKTIAGYQQADLILLNGANYAKWISKVSLHRSKMVDTSATFKNRYITMKETITHSHGPEAAHAHESTAFTLWIDFDLAVKQAAEIVKALSRKKSELKDTFQKNYTSLENDLVTLDQEINEFVAKNRSLPLIMSHPVYDYFARRYKLNIKSVHWEPDEVPGDEQWIELRGMLKDHPTQWMIWESDPIKKSVERLKTMGTYSLVFNPCGNVLEQGDFLSVMRENVKNLRQVFQNE